MPRAEASAVSVVVVEGAGRVAETVAATQAAVDAGLTARGPQGQAAGTWDPAADALADEPALFCEEITEEEVEAELRQGTADAPGPAEPGEPAAAGERVAAAEPQMEADERLEERASGEAAKPQQRRAGPTCPACGSNVRSTDKFCIWCGERQPQRALPKMRRCPDCRTWLPLTANFCYVCGNEVSLHLRRKVQAASELFAEDDPELFPRFEA